MLPHGKPTYPSALALLLAGCTTATAETNDLGTAEEAALTANSLTASALTTNALTADALTADAFLHSALTADALAEGPRLSGALGDPKARSFLKYVVGCALPSGTSFQVVVDGTAYPYEGRTGLAPAWGQTGGSCDASCQAWVSACVLARVNYLGVQVALSIRGEHPALALAPGESSDYPHIEATYYGSVLSPNQVRFACLPPGHTSDERVCGPWIDGCVMKFRGRCDEVCDGAGSSGDYTGCHDLPRGDAGSFPAGAISFPAAVTVYLQ
jgi:hypothetical protein